MCHKEPRMEELGGRDEIVMACWIVFPASRILKYKYPHILNSVLAVSSRTVVSVHFPFFLSDTSTLVSYILTTSTADFQ